MCSLLCAHTELVLVVTHMQVGESHASTKESSEYLKSLTQQAVILQKAINQIYSNTPSACAPPPKVRVSTCTAIHNHTFMILKYFASYLSHLGFSPVSHTKPSHDPSAAQRDLWNRSRSSQVNTEVIQVANETPKTSAWHSLAVLYVFPVQRMLQTCRLRWKGKKRFKWKSWRVSY